MINALIFIHVYSDTHALSLSLSLSLSSGRYVMGRPAFIPATPLGVLEILKRCHINTFGKTACIVGRSKNIGTLDK